jgi:hypothetical protein
MITGAPVAIYGVNGEILSTITRTPDNAQGPGSPLRLGARGELLNMSLWNGMEALAMEGSLWCAQTPTPGTGIVLSVAAGVTFSDTQALVLINNVDTPLAQGGTGKSIYLYMVNIIDTVVPTGGAAHHVAHRIDPTQNRGVAGTQLGAVGTAPKTLNSAVGGSSIAQVFALGASAVSVAASSQVRNVGRNLIRAGQWVVGDDVRIVYGARDMAAGGVGIGTNAVSAITVFGPQICIGPGHSYCLNEWEILRTGALSGELVVLWGER